MCFTLLGGELHEPRHASHLVSLSERDDPILLVHPTDLASSVRLFLAADILLLTI